MTRLLIFIAALLFIRFVVRLVAHALKSAQAQGVRPAGELELVRDSICNTFVARDRALAAKIQGETRYFCSDDCRRRAIELSKAS